MRNLEEIATAIAKAIVRQRENAIGCFVVRPKHVIGITSPIYYSVVRYVFDILVQANLAKKYKKYHYVKYQICKDSELFTANEEELKRKIMSLVEEYEKKMGV